MGAMRETDLARITMVTVSSDATRVTIGVTTLCAGKSKSVTAEHILSLRAFLCVRCIISLQLHRPNSRDTYRSGYRSSYILQKVCKCSSPEPMSCIDC